MKTALFPGSFDPITIGHENIIRRALPLFDKLIIAIGSNTNKKYLFSLEQRTAWIKKVFENDPNIEVMHYEGLTVDFCKKINATYIVRGLRNSSDYNYESTIAQMNHQLDNSIETLFLQTTPLLSAINSTIVRDIIIHKGEASKFIPKAIQQDFIKK
ncbi:MAG: pantetheine-phosphate adenylyltransferase [Flavobacteriales bacterium CG18_big_fil_WC_8_21_14_2_50_32_9]|nr:MAG: pantetheine-phosphate adenylyltransferase [Flavobacteriales bacterium CG18_big_fil_WC_8_21_14_2_50_32_9]